MVDDFVALRPNRTAAVRVQLVGRGAAPVRAWFQLSAGRAANGTAAAWLAEEVDAWLAPSELVWGANETGVRQLRLRSALELLEVSRVGRASRGLRRGIRQGRLQRECSAGLEARAPLGLCAPAAHAHARLLRPAGRTWRSLRST